MKVFIADSLPKGYIDNNNYHWCDDGELLMFGQFQLGNGNPSEVSMCGIKTRAFTTNILVKDIDIDKDLYKELITESVERSMDCLIDRDGNYEIEMGFAHQFNINDIVDELLKKASNFEDGQKVICTGKEISKGEQTMTTKQKAIELYDKFHVWDTMTHQEVKRMALIAIDEMILQEVYYHSPLSKIVDYLEEVKQEIEKL